LIVDKSFRGPSNLLVGKYAKKITRAFLHANALFSDTAGKIQLKMMTPPNHSKGLFLP